MPINALLARGIDQGRMWNPLEATSNALTIQRQKQVNSAFPEEQNWLRQSRGMEAEKHNMEMDKWAQEMEMKPIKDSIQKLQYLSIVADHLTPDNYEASIRHIIGVNKINAPFPTLDELRQKAASEEVNTQDPNQFGQYFKQEMAKFKKVASENEKSIKEISEATGLKPGTPEFQKVWEQVKGINKEQQQTEQTPVWPTQELAIEAGKKSGIPEGMTVTAEPTKGGFTYKHLPMVKGEKVQSMGNAVELAINRKFQDPSFLTDPEKHKEALKWLGTPEGIKSVQNAAQDVTPPAITMLQTGEGFVPVQTKGAGMGTIGKPSGLGKPIPAEQVGKIGELETLLDNIKTVKDIYNSGWVGPVSGRMGAVKEKYTGGASDDQVKFYAYVRDMKDALLRARSGAQINEQEYKRLVGFLPDENLPPKTFMARLTRFEESLNTILTQKKKAFSESGYSTAGTKTESKKSDPLGIR